MYNNSIVCKGFGIVILDFEGEYNYQFSCFGGF